VIVSGRILLVSVRGLAEFIMVNILFTIGTMIINSGTPYYSPQWRGGREADGVVQVMNKRNSSKYHELPYNDKLIERAKEFRKAGILSEVILWKQIKNGKFKGLDFDRQKIIGNFIVDFYCAEKSVVIEVDGSSHDERVEYDTERDYYLKGLGLTVLRISDKDVKTNLRGVMLFLENHNVFK